MLDLRKIIYCVIASSAVIILLYCGLISGIIPYAYYRTKIITISDAELGWFRKSQLEDEMAQWPGPCAKYASESIIRILNKKNSTPFDRSRIIARKKSMIGRRWGSLSPRITATPIFDVKGTYFIMDYNEEKFKLQFIIGDDFVIKDITISQVTLDR